MSLIFIRPEAWNWYVFTSWRQLDIPLIWCLVKSWDSRAVKDVSWSLCRGLAGSSSCFKLIEETRCLLLCNLISKEERFDLSFVRYYFHWWESQFWLGRLGSWLRSLLGDLLGFGDFDSIIIKFECLKFALSIFYLSESLPNVFFLSEMLLFLREWLGRHLGFNAVKKV